MAETETPNAEPAKRGESGSPPPEADQEPARGRRKGLIWGGAIVGLLAIFTVLCLCLAGVFLLQLRDGWPTAATFFELETLVFPAQEGQLEVPPLALPEEDEEGEEEELLALEQLPMVQPEVAMAAPQMLEMRAVAESSPFVEYFWADPALLKPGQCSTLRWGAVLGATWAGIEPGIGGIGTPGDRVVCPPKTTTYILTAKGAGGESFASATVSVGAGADRGTVVLGSEGPLDGYRSNDGRGSIRHDILAANAEFNQAGVEVVWRGFMSFDLSAIPLKSRAQRAELRFYQVRVGGDPYGKLGRLVLEHVVYGDRLTDAAFHVAAMDALVLAPQTGRRSWYVVASPALAEWIAKDRAAGRNRLQVRVRWEQETDGDGREDWASIESPENFFGTGNAPELKVTYGP
jgi:hypothetical protein